MQFAISPNSQTPLTDSSHFRHKMMCDYAHLSPISCPIYSEIILVDRNLENCHQVCSDGKSEALQMPSSSQENPR